MLIPKKTYLFLTYIFAKTAPRFWQHIQNKIISICLYYLWGSKQRVLHTNTAQVLGVEPDSPLVKKTVIQLFRNYGLYLRDYVLIHDLTKENYKETVASEMGTEYIEKALADGNGAILITPHLGNWELGGVTFAFRGCPIYALTLKDTEDTVQEYRDDVRGSLGIKTIHVDPTDHGTILQMARLLKANNVIAMLGDRLVGGKKSSVTFFGKNVYFPSGAMVLAQATGAPIIPVFITLRKDNKYNAWMEKPIIVKREPGMNNDELIAKKTQELASVFEKNIRKHPDQWYQFFDYWSTYSSEDTSS